MLKIGSLTDMACLVVCIRPIYQNPQAHASSSDVRGLFSCPLVFERFLELNAPLVPNLASPNFQDMMKPLALKAEADQGPLRWRAESQREP